MSKKGRVILNTILISVAILAAGFFVFKNYFWADKKLTDFLPTETKAYFEINLADDGIDEFYKENFKGQIKFQKLLNESGMWGDFNSESLKSVADNFGLVILDEGQDRKQAWLIKTKLTRSIDALVPADYYMFVLDSGITVVAKERETINLFRSAKENLVNMTLTEREIYAKFTKHKFLNAYLSKDFLQELIENKTEWSSLFLNYVGLDEVSPAYMSLLADGDKLVVNFQAAGENFQTKTKYDQTNYGVMKNIFTRQNIKAGMGVSILKDVLDEVEKKLSEKYSKEVWQEMKNEWSTKYNFKWGDLYDIMRHPGFVVFDRADINIDWKNFIETNRNGVLVLVVSDEIERENFYVWLKDLISRVLAFDFPQEKQIELEDKTFITSKVADPQNLNWRQIGGVDFFEEDGVEIALAKDESNIYLGEDKDKIQEILEKKENNKKISLCPDFDAEESIYLQTGDLQKGLLRLVDETLIFIENESGGINAKGCLMW